MEEQANTAKDGGFELSFLGVEEEIGDQKVCLESNGNMLETNEEEELYNEFFVTYRWQEGVKVEAETAEQEVYKLLV